jgi:hypothetical protein
MLGVATNNKKLVLVDRDKRQGNEMK